MHTKVQSRPESAKLIQTPDVSIKGSLSDSGITIDPSGTKDKSRDPLVSHRARPFYPVRIYLYAFFAALLMSLIVFRVALLQLARFSAHSEYSYIPLIPLISAFLIFVLRESIFEKAEPSPWLGSCIVAGGMLLWFVKEHFRMGSISDLELSALALVSTWCGLFVFWYGPHAARMALLPLSLLLFMVPAPESVLNAVIQFLQQGSTVLSCDLFRVLGVPALQDGTVIVLPQLTLQVSPECSGIRSSISLLILTLVVGNLYLRSGWNKILLVLIIVPLVLVKNAIRIVTLSLLALYVNPGFLNGPLHRHGGILFFLIALAMLIPIVMVMRWLERRGEAPFGGERLHPS